MNGFALRRSLCIASAIAGLVSIACGGHRRAEPPGVPDEKVGCGGFELVVGSGDQPVPDEEETRSMMLKLEVRQRERAGARLAPPPTVFSRELLAWQSPELFHLIPSVRFDWKDVGEHGSGHPCGEEFSISLAASNEWDTYVPLVEVSLRYDQSSHEVLGVNGESWSAQHDDHEFCAVGQGLELVFRPVFVPLG